MSVSMEVVQGMMAELPKQNAENLATLAKQQFDAFRSLVEGTKTTTGMTDTRGIGRPVSFKSDEGKYGEWKAKLLAYLRVAVPNSDSWIQWCWKQQIAILESDIDVEFGNDAFIVKEFAVKFHSILLSCTEDDAFRICHSVKDGNGLEAMRLLVKRYEPRTPGTKRALLKAVINNAPGKKPEEIEKNLMSVKELMKKYEVLGGEPLPEDLRVTVIIDLCTKDFKEHLELITREMKYKEARDEIMSFVERKRDLFGTQLKAMEVDNYEEMGEQVWWGGSEPWYGDGWEVSSGGEVCQMNAYRGKGPWQKKVSKGKGGEKGEKGWGKEGGNKGNGKGDKDKREAVSKATVIGAASGVIPKVVVATRTST